MAVQGQCRDAGVVTALQVAHGLCCAQHSIIHSLPIACCTMTSVTAKETERPLFSRDY